MSADTNFEVRMPMGQISGPVYTYLDSYSAYGTCSEATSTKSRTATCTRTDDDNNSTVVGNSFCEIGETVTACLPGIYIWAYGVWGSRISNVKERWINCRRTDPYTRSISANGCDGYGLTRPATQAAC